MKRVIWFCCALLVSCADLPLNAKYIQSCQLLDKKLWSNGQAISFTLRCPEGLFAGTAACGNTILKEDDEFLCSTAWEVNLTDPSGLTSPRRGVLPGRDLR